MRNYADAEGARMRYRFATLPLMLALAAPSLGAQDSATRANSRVESPPELEVLAQAVEAITTMHMDGFSDTTLWEAALDGLKGLVRDTSDETLSEAQADLLSVVEQARRSAEPEILAQTVARISRLSVDGVSDSTLWEAAIDGLIGALDDPYAELFTEVESDAWEEETTGNYSGIGLQITLLNEEVTVTAVFRSTPAKQVGIIVGDIIVGVNTNDASDWTTGMAADSIRGPVGTDVLVKIKRAGFDEPIGFDITRAQVHVPAVHYGVLESNIGYVLLDRVARNAAQEMNSALAELADTRGLVIDLRRNPGGFLDESLMLADLFLKPGSTLASTVQRRPDAEAYETETDSFEDRWPQLVPDLPIVILVDRFTASGAEILAGALQDYDRALVLGERSFGKGVVQTVMRLPYSRRLRFTTGSWHTPLGRSLQRARDSQFRPIAEDLDTFPRVNTAQGRSLINGGGIFPDLALADDTTTLVERELIRAVNEQEVPLGLRLAELGFEAAGARRDEGTEDPALTDEEFDGFIARLVEEGLSEDQLSDEGVRTYLRWRGRITVAQRMDDLGAEADIRMERDPVLSEAVRLLLNSTSQVQLFEAAEAEQARRDEGTGEL
ncbi:MAG: S41 family peptidase [Gemmatimonadota bacterium]|nr:S41 family peptidase [Gemmatimonadota bacterium]|tara:strand:+ start:4060 stop:5892 length:1833 start_codon:yes stop_codon:yes gene_type:complete